MINHSPDSTRIDQARRLLADEGLTQSPPRPGPVDWLGEVGSRALDWLSSVFGLDAEATARLSKALAFSIAAGALVVVVALLVLAWQRRRQLPPAERIDAETDPDDVADMAAPDWRQSFDQRLRAGDLRAAIQALWCWWLAALGVDRPANSSMTGRRLVFNAGRRDLLPLVGQLEALTYGEAVVGAEGLARLFREIERSTVRGSSASGAALPTSERKA